MNKQLTPYEEFLQTLEAQYQVSSADKLEITELQFKNGTHKNYQGKYTPLFIVLSESGYSSFMVKEYQRLRVEATK